MVKAKFRGHVFWETLPPGLLLRQMEVGGKITSGKIVSFSVLPPNPSTEGIAARRQRKIGPIGP
jgi:hypothetical protein